MSISISQKNYDTLPLESVRVFTYQHKSVVDTLNETGIYTISWDLVESQSATYNASLYIQDIQKAYRWISNRVSQKLGTINTPVIWTDDHYGHPERRRGANDRLLVIDLPRDKCVGIHSNAWNYALKGFPIIEDTKNHRPDSLGESIWDERIGPILDTPGALEASWESLFEVSDTVDRIEYLCPTLRHEWVAAIA